MPTRVVHGSLQIGDGSSPGGGGTTVTGGGGGSGTTTPIGVTVVNPGGLSLADIRTLELSGLHAVASGPNRATLTPSGAADLTAVDAVISGGNWAPRDLVASPSYQFSVTAGSGMLQGRVVQWPASTVTTPAENSVVYVDAAGVVRARGYGTSEPLAPSGQLMLWRTLVDNNSSPTRIAAVIESRTFDRLTPRAPLFLDDRIREAQVTSGPWAGATAMHENGDIIWAFANTALIPFIETHTAQAKAHLDIQIATFYGTGVGTGETDWTTLHGTTWSGYYNWPYDVSDPRGTPQKQRADSHDAYAGSFARLAVAYARRAPGGLTWWDANVQAVQNALYYNNILRLRFNGGGYLNETFQDATIYPFCQTMDQMEVWRGLTDARTLMRERGGSQATWADTYQGAADNILAGIQAMWRDTPNSAGETGWMAAYWNNATSDVIVNEQTRWYPDLVCGVIAAMYSIPLHATPSIARTRIMRLFNTLNTKAPGWYRTRTYDLFPWGATAVAAMQLGFRDIGEAWLSYVQRHHAVDSVGYFPIEDVGNARWIERLLGGQIL